MIGTGLREIANVGYLRTDQAHRPTCFP